MRRSNGGQESNRVKRESSRVTPSRGGNRRYKVIARKQRQSSQDRSITSQAPSAPRSDTKERRSGGKRAIGGMEGMMGGEASGPGRRRGGITNNSKQAKHETRKRRARWAMARTALLQSFAECSPACRNWPTTTSGQVADDDRDPSCVDIAHNLREDFTGLYWWHGPICRGQTPRCLGRPHAKAVRVASPHFLAFAAVGCTCRRQLGYPGRSWALLDYPGCPG